MTGNVENTNSMIFRCVLQLDQYFNRLLCVAHINKRKGSSETSGRDSKQVLELRDAHVTSWSCGVASDQRLRQVGDHKTKPYHTQKDLKWQGGGVKIKPFLTGGQSLENLYRHTWKNPARMARAHAIWTLYASRAATSTLSVPLVPFTIKLLLGAILSVTLPIMILITANVPEHKKPRAKSEGAPSVPADEPVTLPTNGDVSGCTKDEVNQHREEWGVQAKHWR